MSAANGKIKQVIGPVVDVEFPDGSIPEILSALKATNPSIDDSEGNLVPAPGALGVLAMAGMMGRRRRA